MSVVEARDLGEKIAQECNPKGTVPFPFDALERRHADLHIIFAEDLPDDISGGIGYSEELQTFSILVNKNKPEKRRYFTLAHEVGHYLLHKEKVKEKKHKVFVDTDGTLDIDGMIFRADNGSTTQVEREANNFAGALLMPTERVKEAWGRLKDIAECADVFGVSNVAMSVRLQILGLTDE
jgi:Zn-dependent peptidase ImmA (M78 family)